MFDKISLKKIITDFQRYSTNLMNTNYEECDANFRRFKKYIDENELISNIIQEKIKLSSIDYKECFLIQNSSWGEEFSVPNDESDHIKAIYDYMDMIEKSDIAFFNIAGLYSCQSNKFVDIIHNFNTKVILPLIDYVNIELSKKLLEYDEFYPTINFSGNNSPVFFQSTGNQNVTYVDNDLDKINALISSIITSISDLESNVINKDELKDDIAIMQESLNSNKPNIPRIKRIFDKVSNTICGITTTIGGVALISDKLHELWPLIEKFIK